MDSIENVFHQKFTYVFIPRDMADAVELREFEGTEKDFKAKLNLHFSHETFLEAERSKFSNDLLATSKGAALDVEHLNRAIDLSQSAQIIPLTLPTKATNYEGVNAYIDNVGRVKNLPTNARATRIAGDDIRGDCFISRTYDDEEDFKRISFSMNDYQQFLEAPPSRSGRWDQNEALAKLQQQLLEGKSSEPSKKITEIQVPFCSGCNKKEGLKKCTRCLKAHYCSQECQRGDWKFHKRVCHP